MFEAARLKLTAWYLLIIMIISTVFSVAFYRAATVEIERIIHIEELRTRYGRENVFFHRNEPMQPPSIQDLEEIEKRLQVLLILINSGIFILAGASGYFLAGRTLRPIKDMVDEQHRFVTDASHELRTPLTALRSEIEVGLRDKKMSVADAKALLESNLEEVINLQNLSDNLLRLTQSKTTPTMSMVSISVTIDTAVKKVSAIAKEKDMVIKTKITETTILGDETALGQLFVILLDNAIKYSPPKTEITVTTEKTDHGVVVSVADHGEGIDKKDLPYIFDRFYRVDKSRSRNLGGYGLGLSIAKKIVAEHHGIITVESKLEKGTTFKVQLPKSFSSF